MKNSWGREVQHLHLSARLKDAAGRVIRSAKTCLATPSAQFANVCGTQAWKSALQTRRSFAAGMSVAGILSIIFLSVSAWAQAPVNDDFANASVITGGLGSTNGSNLNATLEAGETNQVYINYAPDYDYYGSLVPVANSVWFQWTAPTNGYVTFDTVGSLDQNNNTMDTVLAAWTGNNVSSLTLVAADSDLDDDVNNVFYPAFANFDVNSILTFYAVANTTYSISVDLNAETGAQPGNYVLNWDAQQPANAAFTNDMVISGLQGTVSGNNFNALGNTFVSTNLNFNSTNSLGFGVTNSPYATNQVYITDTNDLDYAGSYLDASNTLWFQWVATQSGMATFDTIGSTDLVGNPMNTVVAVWTGNSVTNLIPVAADGDTFDDFGPDSYFDDPNSSVTFPAVAGTNYYISVHLNGDNGGQPGNYVLNWDAQDPVNDNLGNATTLNGTTGTVTGSNLNATTQANEITQVNTDDNGPVDVGYSIWYKWTATQNGNVSFDTIGSVDELGNQMDTVLGVWTGNNVASLTKVAMKDNAYTNQGTDLNSSVQFYATAGTTYKIAVYVNNDAGGLPGNIVLNWNANQSTLATAPAAGTFQFTSPQYQFSQNESGGTIHANMRAIPARATITRIGGADGMVDVSYYVTNTWYTNWVDTVIYQSNTLSTLYATNPTSNNQYSPVGTSNVTTTIFNITQVYQDYDVNDGYFNVTNLSSALEIVTNFDGVNLPIYFTNGLPYVSNLTVLVGTPPNTNFFSTNYFNPNASTLEISTNEFWITNIVSLIPPAPAVTNSYGYYYTTNFLTYTNLTVTNIISTLLGSMSESGPQQTVFNDFQMNDDISLPVSANQTLNLANPLAVIVMTGASLDLFEDPSLPDPQISPTRSTALVSFYSPFAIIGQGIYGANAAGSNVFNFARSTVRCDKTVDGNGGTAYVAVTCPNHTDNSTATVYYRIDYATSSDDGNNFKTQAGSDYARPDNANLYTTANDFTSSAEAPSQLNFPPHAGTASVLQYIAIPITQDSTVKFNQDIQVELYYPLNVTPVDMDGYIGNVNTCTLTVLMTTPPAGAVDTSWNAEENPETSPPQAPILGANQPVNAVVVQPTDGKSIIGGVFNGYSSSSGGNQNYIARLNTDGSLDTSFNINEGFGGGFLNGGNPETPAVIGLALDANQNVIAVGEFTSFNGQSTNATGIARLLPSGAADPTFDNCGSGPNFNVRAVALQPNGQILIGGDFTSYNGTNCPYIARLNTDGSLDTSFNPGQGPNGSVYAIGVQANGDIVIGGAFTTVDGATMNYISRLNTNGTLDTTFSNLYTGANNVIDAIAIQTNGLILAGGSFTSMEGYTNLSYLARLNPDGSVDTNFVEGTGPNNTVNCITLNTIQNDGTFFIGGYFTSINGTRRVGIARILPNGWVDTTFMDTANNQFAGVVNNYYSDDPTYDNAQGDQPNPINAIALEPVVPPTDEAQAYDVIIGGSFGQVGGDGGLTGINYTAKFDREAAPHPRENVARLIGGSTPGPGNLLLTQNSYSPNNSSGNFFVTMTRTNGTLGTVAAMFEPVQTGSGVGYAAPGIDYTFSTAAYSTPTWGSTYGQGPAGGAATWMLEDGWFGPNNTESSINPAEPLNTGNTVFVDIFSNSYPGTVSLNADLVDPKGQDTFFLGGNAYTSASDGGFGDPAAVEGENIPLSVALGTASSPMLINHLTPYDGTFNLSQSYYYVAGNTTDAVITVTRTGGTANTVTLKYATGGGTAVIGKDYTSVSGTLNFFGGISSTNILVPIVHDPTNQPDRTFGISIFTPSGGALGTLTNATVEIVNENIGSGFAEFVYGTAVTNVMYYGVNENAGEAQISVGRLGGASGVLQVTLSTTNGTASNGTNYIGLTTNLVWNSGISTIQTVNIPILDSGMVSSNLTVKLKLSNATLNGSSYTNLGAFTNAVLTITNTDSAGQAEFTASSYTVNESAGYALIPIVRTGGSAGNLSVQFYTLNGTAINGLNYLGTTNTVIFGPGQVNTNFVVAISNLDSSSTPNFFVVLTNTMPTNGLGSPNLAEVTINGSQLINEPPGQPDPNYSPGFNAPILSLALQGNGELLAGGEFTVADGLPRNYIALINTNGTLDTSFLSPSPSAGANAPVETIAIETNGLILVGGEFTTFNSGTANYMTRLNLNGSVDTGFNPGSAANNPVYALAQTFVNGQSRIVVGGAFTSFNTYSANSIVQLLDNGQVDPSFSASANATVYAVTVQPNGQILVGGDFTNVDGVAVNHIARLNANGTVDFGFTNALSNPAAGANAAVDAITLQLDGHILIGGYFTNVDGVPCNYIARLNANGSLDTSFTNALTSTAIGANGPVSTISLQPDTRIIVGGNFTEFNGVTRNRITRLNPNGTTDPTIDFGAGADGFVAASVIQNDGNIVLGGGFQNYDSQPHPYLVRIFGGSLAGSGSFQFSAANYQVTENGVVAPITIIRNGGTSGTNSDGSGNVYVTFTTGGGGDTAVAGVNYSSVSNTVIFPAGEVQEVVDVPVMSDPVPTPSSWQLQLNLINPQPASVVSIVGQYTAELTILNTSSAIGFSSAAYQVPNNVANGEANIDLILQGYTNNTSSVVFSTTGGTAVPGVEYLPVPPTTVTFNPGVTNVVVQVPIIPDTNYTGYQTVTMSLTSPANAYLYAPTNATLTIVDTANAVGQVLFASSNYIVNESSGAAVVTVLYTNGDLSASVGYMIEPGTAQLNVNYLPPVTGVLSFNGNQTAQTITVPLSQYNTPTGPLNFSIVLTNISATGGPAIIPPTNTVVTILDDINTGVAFASGTNAFEETNGIFPVLVDRLGNPNSGAFTVNYMTTDGTAVEGVNYVTNSGTLSFSNGQSQAVIPITLINNNDFTNLQFNISLFSATAPAVLAPPSNTVVIIEPSATGLSFVSSNTAVLKTAGFVVLPVLSSGTNVGPVAVNYSTGGGTASPGVDYTATSGTLTFTNGQTVNFIEVPILPNTLLESNLSFNVTLSSPTYPGILVPPSTETVTILETNTPVGLNFYSPVTSNSDWGTITIDDNNPLAILEGSTVWVAWTPTNSGEVEFDTIGSVDDVLGITNLSTAMGVFTGNSPATLNTVVVNGGMFNANFGYVQVQQNVSSQHIFDLSTSNGVPVAQSFESVYDQHLGGPSEVRFNAVANQTYYIAVVTSPAYLSFGESVNTIGGINSSIPGVISPADGLIKVNWSFHPSGVFQFAQEDLDETGLTYSNGIPMLLYRVSETEGDRRSSGSVDAGQMSSTIYGTTYPAGNGTFAKEGYDFDIPGLQVTVTRVAGSSGEVHVGYQTEDITTGSSLLGTNGFLLNGDLAASSTGRSVANGGGTVQLTDYTPVSGTLTFGDSEMSKTIFIPINDDNQIPEQNRDFLIVLTNATLDSSESPDVQPPRLDTTYSTTLVRILDTDIDPKGPSEATVVTTNITLVSTNITTNVVYSIQPTNGVYNFMKAHFQVTRDIDQYWGSSPASVTVYVNRTGTNQNGSTLYWQVGNDYLDNSLDEIWPGDFPLQPGSDYATPTPVTERGMEGLYPDFSFANNTYNGSFSFGTGKRGTSVWNPQAIMFNIETNGLNQFNEDFVIYLYEKDSDGNYISPGMVDQCTVTILTDDNYPPAGSVDERYNPDFGQYMIGPYASDLPNPGADGEVEGLAVQPDNKTIIVGQFPSYNDNLNVKYIVRANTDGSQDPSFSPGSGENSGPNDYVSCIELTTNYESVIGGGFSSYSGSQAVGIALVTTNGTLDPSFNSGSGFNGPVYALAFQTNGEILVGGDFTSYNGTPCDYLALVNLNGVLDSSFNPSTNLNAAVYAVAVQASGQVIVGGDFTSAGGVSGQDYLTRLNPDGSLDASFDPGSGANNAVFALGIQPDGNIVVGGEFSTMNGQTANNLARLTANGFTDPNFYNGVGADGPVHSITIATNTIYWTTNDTVAEQTNFTIYVGGAFTSINNTHRLGFARLNPDGSLDTTFLDTAYNEFAGLPRDHYNDPLGTVLASGIQSDGNVMIGGSFERVGGGQSDDTQVRPELVDSNDVAVIEGNSENNGDAYPLVQKTRSGVRNRSNVARLIGGATPGPGNISLLPNTASGFTTVKSNPSEAVHLIRSNGCLGPASANFSVLPGLAQSGVDYSYEGLSPLYWIAWENNVTPEARMHSDGYSGTNGFVYDPYGRYVVPTANETAEESAETLATVQVSVFDNTNNFNNLSASFQLSDPLADQFYLGGQNIPLGVALGQSIAPFTLIDDHEVAGTFGFSMSSYTTTNQTAVISVVRTNGNYGQVSLSYATTTNGSAAIQNSDYQGVSGTLTFQPGDTVHTFSVPILYTNSTSSTEKTVNMMLFGLNPPANAIASWGISNAVLRIINPNFQGYLTLSAPSYAANLSAGSAIITVNRTVGSLGALGVQFATANGTATNGTDFVGVTNTLSWNSGDVSPRTVVIPLINHDIISGAKQFNVSLSTPTLNGNSAPALFATNAVTNAVVTINNDNSYGTFEFSSPTYIVNEDGGTATLTVLRTGGTNGTAQVQYATADGTAVAGLNYLTNSGTLTFAPGQLAAVISVTITNLGVSEPPPSQFYFTASISSTNAGVQIGTPSTAQIQIVSSADYNQTPGSPDTSFNLGAGMNGNVFALALQANGQILAGGNFSTVDAVPENNLARLNTDGTLDRSGFLYGLSGASGSIYSVAVQTDNQILVGGSFTNFNGSVVNNVARLNTDGSLDSSFNLGAGANGTVYSVAEAFVGGVRKIYAGGAFGSMNGQNIPFIARLNENGTVDTGFSAGAGPNATVYAIAVYPTNSPFAGDVLIGGAFTNVNNFAVGGIARLNSAGSIDTNFDSNLNIGANGIVRTIAIQSDGRVVIGGDFTNVDGVPLNHIARLNADGSLDTGFASNVGAGLNASVSAIALQADNRIVVAGQFTLAYGITRNYITRLLPNGTMDDTINFGYGANGTISAAIIQPANQFIVIGGSFTQYNNQPAGHVARIYGGSITGSGSFEFSSANYQVFENGTVAPITIERTGGASGGNVSVNFATITNGSTAIPNVNYVPVSTNVLFPPGVVLETVAVPVLSNSLVSPIQWTLNLALSNPTAPATIVNSNATLTILNDNSFVSFSSASYSVPKDILTGLATLDVTRQGASAAACSVNLVTTTNGTATPGVDFNPTNITVNFNAGQTNFLVPIQILNNANIGPNLTVVFALTNAVNTLLVAPTNTTLTIINTSTGAGELYFASTNFVVNESGLSAVLTVLRTNGYGGSISANYTTTNGTAQAGVNYVASSGSVTLNDGDTFGTITIPLEENNPPEVPVYFSVLLSNPSQGASLIAPTNATVTINDDVNTGVSFVNTTNYFEETNGQVSVLVQRLGNLNGNFSVQFATTNGTALAGVNYVSNSSTLNFTPNETQAGISITLINNQDVSNLMFGLSLSGVTAGVQLLAPSNTVVVETPADTGITLTSPTNSVLKSGGSIAIPVVCLNPSLEPVVTSNTVPLSVNYSTVNGTAQAGEDYTATSGTLYFTNGIVTNTITVPILNNNLITGLRTFSVFLSSPEPVPPAKLVSPTNQVITIIDSNSGLSFSTPNYSILSGGLAIVTVVRTDNTNTLSTVAYSTVGGGSAIPYTDYYPTNGVLTFNPGQTSATFGVNVIGSSGIQPNKTVVLELSNPTPATSVLAAPDVATLTIYNQNGSDIAPAGVALVSTNGAPYGILQSGQQVTLWFSFYDAGGLNVSNLWATLLQTANVTPASSTPVSYGPLIVNGPSASRQFTLTPIGTNGQTILATFKLEVLSVNNTTNYETNAFGLTIGTWTTTFSNTNAIVINQAPANFVPQIASPYPSVITVSNVGGVVVGSTVTLTNFTATSPEAVGVLVVSPSALDTLLMGDVGNPNNGANHVTLTFSDAATNSLPPYETPPAQPITITNGVYLPTQYGTLPNFP